MLIIWIYFNLALFAKINEFEIEMILSRIQLNTSNHADTETFLVLLVQPVKIVFHSGKISTPGDIFSCLVTPLLFNKWSS